MDNETYKKREGTSGIQGHLYETKLISLIYYRMLHDKNVIQFNLATNRDDIGAFDDICFKAKIKGFKKPVNVFIQAKHREKDKLLTFNNKTDLAKYFNSFLEIRRAFEPSSKDKIFGGNFEETECFFVMYTTAKDDPNNKIYKGSFADYLNKLIGTRGFCTQASYTDEDLDFLCKIVMKEQITTLAEQLAQFICNESDSELSMNNDLMLRYHVILAQNVLHVSEIQPEGHRIARFRQDFFTTNEEFIVLFKNILCLEFLKKRKSEETDLQNLLLKFLSKPSEVTILSKLIGSVLSYKKSKLEFVGKMITDNLKRQLDKANVSQSTVYEAAELAAKEYFQSLKLKVPASFGNKDLTIRGKQEKIEKRLNYLTSKIIPILQKPNQNNTDTIIIDESLGDGLLQLNGGIASAVGNILVFDERSKLLKFTDNCESLGNLAKTWYELLNSKIENLHKYKLDVKVKKIPKLSFERGEYDVSLVKDFYDKLLFYTNQADQNGVEEMLRREIKDHPCSDIFTFRSDLVFLKYHDEIQKLWMTPKVVPYLTKKSKIYENAVSNAMSEPLMDVLNIMHKIKYKDYTFNENGLYTLKLLIETGTLPGISSAWISYFLLHEKRKPFGSSDQALFGIILTESCELTVAKLEQQIRNKDHVVLDLEFIFKLPLENHNTLCEELTNTNKEKILIIVCRNIINSKNYGKRLENIAKAVKGKEIMFVTNKISIDILSDYLSEYFSEFVASSHLMNDERCAFTDFSVESQKKFLSTSKIKVQGDVVSLDTIGDVMSMGLIDEYVFSKLINNETIEICDMAISNKYKKQFYIDRRISRTKNQNHDKLDDVIHKVLKTFYDLKDKVVLITGELGMGKSTLLTHLSLKTKELDPKVWIVRINLPQHGDMVRLLSEKTNISIKECLNLICQAAVCDFCEVNDKRPLNTVVSIQSNELSSGTDAELIRLRVSEDPLKIFHLKVFLHYLYNTEKLIFLFDGLDEINISSYCEFHKVVLSLKTLVCRIAHKHKVWITSRTLDIIENSFGPSYKLENFSRLEQDAYLNTFWESKIQLKNLGLTEIMESDNIVSVTKCYLEQTQGHNEYLRGYALFLDFLKTESPAAGIDFPYDEYYNHFMSSFGLCDSEVSCFPDYTTPWHLRKVAEYFVDHPLISRGLINHFEISPSPTPFPPHLS